MGKFVNSVDEFFKFCEKNEVKFVDFRFTDMKGFWHSISYNIKFVEPDQFTNGIPMDASSLGGWQPIDKSDMLMVPDVESAFLDPFTADPTIAVFCDIFDIYKGELYEKCPRSIAKKAMKYVKDSGMGDEAYFGAENEFFIFDNVKIIDSTNCAMYEIDTEEGEWNDDKNIQAGYNSGHRPRKKGGYLMTQPIDTAADLRAEMMQVLEQVGLKVMLGHHEVAQGQNEIGVKFGNLVEAADNVQILKYVIKMVAQLNGKTVTFMPKPLYGDNGNGMHVHQSVWKNGKNLFYGEGNYANLSDFARWYIGGVLHHARSVAAFTNASTNSYKRLIPGFEAPSILTYSSQNRSASVRIPYGAGEKSVRAEFRFPDSTSNPYLAFAAMLMAGLDGVKNKIEPVGPMDENLFVLTLDEIRERGIEQLPHTLRGSLEALIRDHAYLTGVMSDAFIEAYQHMKFETQVWPYEARPTPYEFKMNFSC